MWNEAPFHHQPYIIVCIYNMFAAINKFKANA